MFRVLYICAVAAPATGIVGVAGDIDSRRSRMAASPDLTWLTALQR
jgi:hypothetical protein